MMFVLDAVLLLAVGSAAQQPWQLAFSALSPVAQARHF